MANQGNNQMTSRRGFLTAVGLASLAAATHTFAQKQTRSIPRIGVLWHAGSAEEEKVPLSALRQGLKDLGYIEGKNILLENRYPAEQPERFQSYAIELAKLEVDVLLAVTRPAALAAQRATSSIPIVFVVVPDPVGSKIVSNLAKPGGNITGLSTMAVELTAKRIELLKETVRGMSRVGLLVNMNDPEGARRYIEVALTAAALLKVTVQPVEVRAARDFEGAFASMSQQKLQGVVSTQDGLFYVESRRMAALALKHRLPLITFVKEAVEAGALLSYGPSSAAIFRRAGIFVDKILKGTKPGDLPVELPMQFELFVNDQTARTIGVQVAPSVKLRADKVID